MNEVHLLIEGRVQHVGFRRFVLRQAEHLNLCGWVRNDPNGSVEVYASGNQGDIVDFINSCRKGSLFSNVYDVQFLDVKEQDKLLCSSGMFKILYD